MSSHLVTLSQVFGGCCTNVFVLDKIISKNTPNSPDDFNRQSNLATIVTFSQFLFVSVAAYGYNADFKNSSWRRLYLRESKVPLHNWLLIVLMYFTVSLCNNWSYSFHISIPTYIVFRLSGTVITMLVGWLFGGKVFNKVQILSCLIITLGVVLNTLPEDWYRIILKFFYNHTHIHADKSSYPPLDPQFYIGVLLLISSTVLLAVMGLYNEKIHKKYGNQWKESLFYTHFLGLPLFMFVYPKITLEFLQIWNDRDVYQSFPIVSKQFINLGLNVISQFFCIKGVNVLVGSTLALSVIIILLIRKFISFFISILWFGHELTINGMVGGSMVLIGAAIYSVAGQTKRRKKGKNNKSYINLKKLSDDEKVKEKQPIVNQKTE